MAAGLALGGDVEQALESVGVPSYVLDDYGSRPLDQSGSRAASRRHSRPPLHVRRRARGDPVAPTSWSPRSCSAPPRATEATGFLVSTAGTRVAVELSSVPLMSGEQVVGVFGLVEELPDDTLTAPPPRLTPRQVEVLRLLEQGRSTKQIAAELHLSIETVKKPHPPALSGPRRPFPARSRRRRPGRTTPGHRLAGKPRFRRLAAPEGKNPRIAGGSQFGLEGLGRGTPKLLI